MAPLASSHAWPGRRISHHRAASRDRTPIAPGVRPASNPARSELHVSRCKHRAARAAPRGSSFATRAGVQLARASGATVAPATRPRSSRSAMERRSERRFAPSRMLAPGARASQSSARRRMPWDGRRAEPDPGRLCLSQPPSRSLRSAPAHQPAEDEPAEHSDTNDDGHAVLARGLLCVLHPGLG